jgi:hypothetical protein
LRAANGARMSKRAALVALTQNRGEIDAALLARLLAAAMRA